jgi:Rad3-related DNA helicase
MSDTESRNVEITREDVVEALQECLKVSPMIKASTSLINTVFNTLLSLYVEDYNYVILEAPTGSGKTIIGFIIHFCSIYLYEKVINRRNNLVGKNGRFYSDVKNTYYLTSSKVLQEQIETDITRFAFEEFLMIIKGADNYNCRKASIAKSVDTKRISQSDDVSEVLTEDLPVVVKYPERPCVGSSNKQRNNLASKYYCQFNETKCDYHIKRTEAAETNCVVMNYAFFLNCMRIENNPFFSKRPLVICDEAHLIPDIVCNIFNYEINPLFITRVQKLNNSMLQGIGNEEKLLNIDKLTKKMHHNLFTEELSKDSIDRLLEYVLDYDLLYKAIIDLTGIRYDPFDLDLNRIKEQMVTNLTAYDSLKELIERRPEDLYIESSVMQHAAYADIITYRHSVKDLSESTMTKNKFLSSISKAVFMSATLGNIAEYATLMGIDEDEYKGFRLQSTFDFTKSPIHICKSAYLNWKSFDSNIDKVLLDAIKIAESEKHRDEKGIIHTSTFKIAQILQAKITGHGLVPDYHRYLFYENADEKEYALNLLKNSFNIPYVIVGPSLYEGIDLKDELGRFNILVKVPYAALSGYTKEKSDRYPFWYKRNTIEKIIQAIGRTNRSVNDYSSVYLLDSCFSNLIYDLPEEFINRFL